VEAKKEGGPSRADGIKVPKVEDHKGLHRQIGGSEMKLTTVGVDIAKNVIGWSDLRTHPVLSQARHHGRHDALDADFW
jgi:hypothetical protein